MFILKATPPKYIKSSFLERYIKSFSESPEPETCLITITRMSGDKHPNRSSLTAADQRCWQILHIWPEGPPIESIHASGGSD